MLIKALKYKNSVKTTYAIDAISGETYFCPGCKNVVFPVKPKENQCHYRLAKGLYHNSVDCWNSYSPTSRKTVAASSANGILDAIMSNPNDGNRGGGGGDGGGEGQVKPFRTVTQMIDHDLHKLPPDVPFGDGSLLCDALIARPSNERIMDTPEQLHRRILEVRMNKGMNTDDRKLFGVVMWGDHKLIDVHVVVEKDDLFQMIKDRWYEPSTNKKGEFCWAPQYDYMYFACNWTFAPCKPHKKGDYTLFGTLRGTIVARKQVAKGSKKIAKNEKKAK